MAGRPKSFTDAAETIPECAKSNLSMNDFPNAATVWPFLIPIVAICGGFLVAIVSTVTKGRLRELEIRERIAMIERGMVPPPEADPVGFEKRMHVMDTIQHRHHGPRFRTAGVTIMSVGFGLMTLLWFVGVPSEALGVGGFLVIMGLGFLVNSVFSPPRGDSSIPASRPSNGPDHSA